MRAIASLSRWTAGRIATTSLCAIFDVRRLRATQATDAAYCKTTVTAVRHSCASDPAQRRANRSDEHKRQVLFALAPSDRIRAVARRGTKQPIDHVLHLRARRIVRGKNEIRAPGGGVHI